MDSSEPLPKLIVRIAERVREEIILRYDALLIFRAKVDAYCRERKGKHGRLFEDEPTSLLEAYVIFAAIHDRVYVGEATCEPPEWIPEASDHVQDMTLFNARCAYYALQQSVANRVETASWEWLSPWFEKVADDVRRQQKPLLALANEGTRLLRMHLHSGHWPQCQAWKNQVSQALPSDGLRLEWEAVAVTRPCPEASVGPMLTEFMQERIAWLGRFLQNQHTDSLQLAQRMAQLEGKVEAGAMLRPLAENISVFHADTMYVDQSHNIQIVQQQLSQLRDAVDKAPEETFGKVGKKKVLDLLGKLAEAKAADLMKEAGKELLRLAADCGPTLLRLAPAAWPAVESFLRRLS